jgi:hypothetical protein
MKFAVGFAAALVLLSRSAATGAAEDQFQPLYQANRWFALRDLVLRLADPPPFYSAAVACAFADFQRCEDGLLRFLKSGPLPADAANAHELLMTRFMAAGNARRALDEAELVLTLRGKASDKNVPRALLAAFSRQPAMTVARFQPSSVACEFKPGPFQVPVQVNGISGKYLIDTGANFSALTESEARRLGLAVVEVTQSGIKDFMGADARVERIAVADRLDLGRIRLEHVPFVILADGPVVAHVQPGEGGFLGLQVLLACRTLRWGAAGSMQLGESPGPRDLAKANLSLVGLYPVVAADFLDGSLQMVLDTGTGATIFHDGLLKQFPALAERAKTGTATGLGGAGGMLPKTEVKVLPEATIRIAGFPLQVRPAVIVSQGMAAKWAHGVIGTEILRHARQIAIDFEAMTLRLRD